MGGAPMLVKFLTDAGRSHYDPNFIYDLPKNGEPGAWITAPGDRPTDNDSCGPNRLHVCHIPYPCDGAQFGVPYEAEGDDLIGQSWGKSAYRQVRLLRRIPLSELFYPGATLSGADLGGADLSGTDLNGANLSRSG